MPINWQDKAVTDRLLAAIIGSFDGKINCSEVARLFGKGASYNAIENFLRNPKRIAKQLRAEADKEGRKEPAASPARPKGLGGAGGGGSGKKGGADAAAGTPTKVKGMDAVKSGRVSKVQGNGKGKNGRGKSAAPATPVKKEKFAGLDIVDLGEDDEDDEDEEGTLSGVGSSESSYEANRGRHAYVEDDEDEEEFV